MQIEAIVTDVLRPPQDDLFAALDRALPPCAEGDIIVVTSKVVAIHQGRCVPIPQGSHREQRAAKRALVAREAQSAIVPYTNTQSHDFLLTVMYDALLPSAGIDESNSDGYYTLLPREPFAAARDLWRYLRRRFGLEHCGVIITDSHSLPLRYGVVGVALGWWGLSPLRNYAGSADLFGRTIRFSQSNVVDALAAAAVVVMGEGAESTPVVHIRGARGVTFTAEDTSAALRIPPQEDLYYPLLKIFNQ